ncbi:MAG: cation transporter [Deltaproteobacteria bacterium]|nr:cation transporter [Deltaproteobacteria bacterium]
MGYYVHHVPGRLRVRIPPIKSRPKMAKKIQSFLSGLEGVEDIAFNHVTGSVVINYDPDAMESDDILDALKEEGYLNDSRLPKNDEDSAITLPKARKAVGRALFGWAVGNLLEDTGLSFLTVLI